MPQGQFIGKPPDRSDHPIWGLCLAMLLAAIVFTVFWGAVVRDAVSDRDKFAAEEDAARRRDDATRCVAGRVDQIARVSMPIATTPPRHGTPGIKPAPKRYAPTTVTLDCEDAKRERRLPQR